MSIDSRDILNNRITQLTADLFKDLGNLQTLCGRCFNDLTSPTCRYIASNKLTSLPPTIFRNLNALEHMFAQLGSVDDLTRAATCPPIC